MDFDWAWVPRVVGLVGRFAPALHLWRSFGEPVETAAHLPSPGEAPFPVPGKKPATHSIFASQVVSPVYFDI